jgi:hypothetical protein
MLLEHLTKERIMQSSRNTNYDRRIIQSSGNPNNNVTGTFDKRKNNAIIKKYEL